MAQQEEAKACNVFYGITDDLMFVTATVVTDKGIVANWIMTDEQCRAHITAVEKYRRLLRQGSVQ